MDMLRESMAVAVDMVLITADTGVIKVLLIRRKNEPYQGKWALPGGFVKQNEELLDAAKRELKEETGVAGIELKQMHSFGGVDRDPRGRVISVAYLAFLPKESDLYAATDAADADWFPIYDLPELAFDHDEIVSYAIKTLRNKIESSAFCKQLLPSQFTLNELQSVYEAILGGPLNNAEFSREILKSGKIIEIQGIGKRDAKFYSFNPNLGNNL